MDTPAKRITIAPNPNRVRVTFAGVVVADSRGTLTLREGSYPPVHYIPRADTNMALLSPTAHTTHCPWKGDAAYFSITAAGRGAENAVWSYETPLAAVAEIAGMLAFYPTRVDSIEELPAQK
jgi:uncharacterized protein (DUF427 family)